MIAALRRRLRYLLYDLRRSAATEKQKKSMDSSASDIEIDTSESVKNLYKLTLNGIKCPAQKNGGVRHDNLEDIASEEEEEETCTLSAGEEETQSEDNTKSERII